MIRWLSRSLPMSLALLNDQVVALIKSKLPNNLGQ